MPKKKKRDMQASAKTLAYFLQTRSGKPTTVKQASRALRVPPDQLYTRLSTFTKSGQLVKLDRGLYGAPSLPIVTPPSKQFNLNDLLTELKQERAALDDHIARVEHVIALKAKRAPAKP